MPQSFQSFNIICIETILSSGDEQHDVLCSTVATVGHGTRLCAVCSAKPAKNVGCIGDATLFSIFQYYMYRDNSILRRRAARCAVLHSSYRRSWDPAMCCVQQKKKGGARVAKSFKSFSTICIY